MQMKKINRERAFFLSGFWPEESGESRTLLTILGWWKVGARGGRVRANIDHDLFTIKTEV